MKRITLYLNLVKAPIHYVEYVLIHAICHMKSHNHSKAFYSPSKRCQPEWHKRKEVLDKIVI